jgi:hypothetical protein
MGWPAAEALSAGAWPPRSARRRGRGGWREGGRGRRGGQAASGARGDGSRRFPICAWPRLARDGRGPVQSRPNADEVGSLRARGASASSPRPATASSSPPRPRHLPAAEG